MRYKTMLFVVVLLALVTLSAWDAWNATGVQAEPGNLTPTAEPPTPTPDVTATNTPTPTGAPDDTPTPTATPLHPDPTHTPLPTHTPGGTIPPATHTPIADGWDRASVSTFGACKDGRPIFNILNSGLGMRESRPFWFLNLAGGAADCAANIAAGKALASGMFRLGAGESADLEFPDLGLSPPLRICIAQSIGHPGIGFASATLASGPCFTGEDVTAEPGARWLLTLPLISR